MDHKELFSLTCKDCRPGTFYRYKDIAIDAFVDMLFFESTGSFFAHMIKAKATEQPEQFELEVA